MNYAIVVNKDHKIKNNYLKKVHLVTAKNILGEDILIEERTYQAYKELKAFLETKNISIGIDSAYRSLEKQQEIYDEFTKEYGNDYANNFVAAVGGSEHHTALAIDLSLIIGNKPLLTNEELMANDYIFKEIHKYLSKFGFILRYKEGKESITGYPYEPWHIRYVGKLIAKIIDDNNYTLEEYINYFSGVLIVNKPKGITSFDVVNEISHLFGIKRVGHTGTLDPLAEGVLVVTIGQATKIAELLTAAYKEYQAGVLLGVNTDTLDITGNVIDTKVVPVDLKIEKTLKSFQKTYLQEVPIYSAVKVNGKKLYEYARNKENITLPKKEVTIKEIKLLSTDRNTFIFKCLVSKGCYIRSLIRDIGLALNNYATMTNLIRTKQGNFSLAESNTLEEIKSGNYHLYKIEEVLDYPVIKVDKKLEFKIRNGQRLSNSYKAKDKIIFITKDNQLLGIYEVKGTELYTWKNFNTIK